LINPIRGEIWRVDLEPTRGAELRKVRPAVVINSDVAGRMPLRLIVPLTGWNDNYRRYFWMARVEATQANGLTSFPPRMRFRHAEHLWSVSATD